MEHTILCPHCGWKVFEISNPQNNSFELCFPCPRCFKGPQMVYAGVQGSSPRILEKSIQPLEGITWGPVFQFPHPDDRAPAGEAAGEEG